MENKIWQSLVKKWSALTGKTPLPAQIASLLSLALVSVFAVFIVLWVAKLSGVSESFLRLLEILLSPTVIICALVLYLWRRHATHIEKILDWVTTLQSWGQNLASKPNKIDSDSLEQNLTSKPDRVVSDPDSSRSKSGNKPEASLSDTVASSGSDNNFNKVEKKAGQGDVEAQFRLGVLYDLGDGVEQNHTEAVKWYRLAAKQGHAKAQSNLGISYREGEGVEQNHTEAVKWFRLAAEQAHANAQCSLGISYQEGAGVEQNHTEAVKWFRLAAEQGNATAQFNLGVLYGNGEGVVQNYSEAYIWLSLASAGNDPDARKARDKVARKLDSNAMKNAQAEATRRAEKIRRKREGESQ